MRFDRLGLVGLIGVVTSGCSTLPSAGPTAGQVTKAQGTPNAPFEIVDLNEKPVGEWGLAPSAVPAPGLAALAMERSADRVGPGDVLAVTVFEIGTRLFGQTAPGGSGGAGVEAQAKELGEHAVQPDGSISLPYVGRIKVVGRTVQEIESLVVAALRGKSQFPQVIVSLRQNVTNTVVMSGDVQKPGRYPISAARENLLDLVAAAGGGRTAPDDIVVRFTRGGVSVEQRLSTIHAEGRDNLVLNGGDHVELLKRPRTYVVFGATQKVTQVDFNSVSVSLAEAVARAGGPDDNKANPAAVFLFRFEPPASAGEQERPVVFRLNMLKPSSYLLSQKFVVRDKDVIYFATADANQPAKLAQIINQLFTPFVLARSLGN